MASASSYNREPAWDWNARLPPSPVMDHSPCCTCRPLGVFACDSTNWPDRRWRHSGSTRSAVRCRVAWHLRDHGPRSSMFRHSLATAAAPGTGSWCSRRADFDRDEVVLLPEPIAVDEHLRPDRGPQGVSVLLQPDELVGQLLEVEPIEGLAVLAQPHLLHQRLVLRLVGQRDRGLSQHEPEHQIVKTRSDHEVDRLELAQQF